VTEWWVLEANSTTRVWCVEVTVDAASQFTAPSTRSICELVRTAPGRNFIGTQIIHGEA